MAPFDPDAIVAMLNAFYLPASPANLARAHRERPAYFAGGTLIGANGDALKLPNGDVWDLLFASDDPVRRRYQAIRPGGAGGSVDPFALEPGAIVFLEPDSFPAPALERTFETLVAEHMRTLAGGDGAVGTRVAIITAAASPEGLDAEFDRFVGTAARGTDGVASSLWDVYPSAEIARSGELVDASYARETDYPDPNGGPGDAPDVDPGGIPADEPAPGEPEPQV